MSMRQNEKTIVSEISTPILSVDESLTTEERLTDNTVDNILPARYLLEGETPDEMFRRVEVSLEEDTSVVLDATFMLARGRMRALELSIIHDVSFHPFRVECDPEVVKDRIRDRQQEGSTDSDADISIYQSIRDRFEPVADQYHRIDNSGAFEETVEQL